MDILFLIIVIVVCGLIIIIGDALGISTEEKPKYAPKYEPSKTTFEPTESVNIYLQDGQEYYVGLKTIGLTARAGYEKMDMVGMQYRAIDENDLGKFEGYAEAEENNPDDPYAIAIYREDHTHVGFLKRDNYSLYNYIEDQGGMVHCYGYIACYGLDENGTPTKYYAEVCVETDVDEVKKRNKPYNTDDKFYDYEEGELKDLLDESQA